MHAETSRFANKLSELLAPMIKHQYIESRM